ncbi:GNAT family N-acetyltransferase [Rhodoplanes sp. TEM]|uniref:GNAT family N-acetyltransferase n=1 Tax=Rhodoplanes tepidamans TaxID=200616 RepID=A0ABT5JJA3_RHOTP|nr:MULTISPECIES: GNAT family N-acetyltransferase [Rhodoplanes]MDC7789379.1 GNAT family N-acetyltransferase [Rhodoplanes tepidamans]MDC7984527.1 GNAT family N-acetyltransferase [Rhodoplanes sp. TEM]MDQ0357936.1 GNAT superfamily N-acetyltransferase [Rhodoplanes tepidamans]
MSDIVVRRVSDDLDPNEIAALYEAVGWGRREDYAPDDLTTAVRRTTFVFAALDGERLVGLLRALSDGVYVTWVAEVVVHPAHQCRGVGTALMRHLLANAGHTSIYAECLAGALPFLDRLGITEKPTLVACSRRTAG